MVHLNLIWALITLNMSLPMGVENENNMLNNNSVTVERDILSGISARVLEGKIYFNLSMLNESKDGIYSLVRTNKDGSIESVGIKEIAVNTINQPILYSFVEETITSENVTYELIRISNYVEIVKTWQYCPKENRICDCVLF